MTEKRCTHCGRPLFTKHSRRTGACIACRFPTVDAGQMVLTRNGARRSVPAGFSWTTLFFGPIPALLRGDLKWGAIQILVHLLLSWTFGVGNLVMAVVFAAIYNQKHLEGLTEQGWEPVTGDELAAGTVRD